MAKFPGKGLGGIEATPPTKVAVPIPKMSPTKGGGRISNLGTFAHPAKKGKKK